VIGMNFYAEFLDQGYHDEMKARHKDLLVGLNRPPAVPPEELDRVAADRMRNFFNEKLPRPPFERILQHIDHAVEVAGVEHVGIGADLDSADIPMPEGFDDVSHYPRIAAALRKRGYPERDVKRIMGGNFLRVFEEVIGR
jgi:membrane dipeptidase